MEITAYESGSIFEITVQMDRSQITEDIGLSRTRLSHESLDGMKEVIRQAYHFENKGMSDVDFIKDLIMHYELDHSSIEDLANDLLISDI